jgi:hypothetical protein
MSETNRRVWAKFNCQPPHAVAIEKVSTQSLRKTGIFRRLSGDSRRGCRLLAFGDRSKTHETLVKCRVFAHKSTTILSRVTAWLVTQCNSNPSLAQFPCKQGILQGISLNLAVQRLCSAKKHLRLQAFFTKFPTLKQGNDFRKQARLTALSGKIASKPVNAPLYSGFCEDACCLYQAGSRSASRHLQTFARSKQRSALPPESGHQSHSPPKSAKGHVWTAPGWQEESSLCSVGRSSHVFGLFARYS